MKVMVIVKATKDSEAGIMPSEKLLTDMGKYNEELANAGIMQAGEGLQPSSKGARVFFSGKSRTVIDGPFAETKELIAGFWMWKVKSMEEAIEWAKRCPNPHEEDCHIEIRPVFSAEDFGEAFTPELLEQESAVRAQSMGLPKPRFEDAPEMTIAGLNERYTYDECAKIPAQWERFAPRIGHVPGQTGGNTAYGVCWNNGEPGKFDYLAGVKITPGAKLPHDLVQVSIPSRRYAVFTHGDHVSSIPKAIEAIWTKWVPDCELKIAKAPSFERYTEEFNPGTGLGGMEIWIPLD